MDEDLIYKMTGKSPEQIVETIAYLEQRSKRTREHQRLTREIFDVQWPSAVRSGSQKVWSDVCVAIDGIIEYLDKNSVYFPNFEEHIAQWETLKMVASNVSHNLNASLDSIPFDDSIVRKIVQVA